MGDPVVAVVQPQPMPVHGGLQIPVVLNLDDELRALLDLEGGAGDAAVQANIRTVASPSRLATGATRRSRVSPPANSSSWGRPASGNPDGSVGNDSVGSAGSG